MADDKVETTTIDEGALPGGGRWKVDSVEHACIQLHLVDELTGELSIVTLGEHDAERLGSALCRASNIVTRATVDHLLAQIEELRAGKG